MLGPLLLRALHQHNWPDSLKVMYCLAVHKQSVKLCHSRSRTDVHACGHRETANGCGGSSPPANAGVMDDVTKSPCEGAVHRLQMLRQVSCPQGLCRPSAAARASCAPERPALLRTPARLLCIAYIDAAPAKPCLDSSVQSRAPTLHTTDCSHSLWHAKPCKWRMRWAGSVLRLCTHYAVACCRIPQRCWVSAAVGAAKSSLMCLGGEGGGSTQAEVAGLRRLLKPGGHARCPQGRLQAPGATRSHA